MPEMNVPPPPVTYVQDVQKSCQRAVENLSYLHVLSKWMRQSHTH